MPGRSASLALTAAMAACLMVTTACSASSVDPGTIEASASPADSESAPQAAASVSVLTITSAEVPAPAPLTSTASGETPQRIVSLATGVGETVAALGLGDRVVGRDETSEAPSIDGAPILTKAHSVSAERVLSTRPDLVLVDAATSPTEALDQIRSTGVRVVEVPEAWTLTDIAARIGAVASALGLTQEAADAVTATAMAQSVTPAGTTRPRVAFLYLRGTSAIYLLGGEGSGADDLLERAGAIDVGAEAGLGPFVPLTAEALAAADPDVLLVMTGGLDSVGGVEGLVSLPGVAQTRAGRERRVIAVEDTLLLSFGPRTGGLVDALAAGLAQVGP